MTLQVPIETPMPGQYTATLLGWPQMSTQGTTR